MFRLHLALLIFAGLFGWITIAAAGDPALADALFEEGQKLMDAGRQDEACAKFEASMKEDPSGGTALNVALCAKERGKLATAWLGYRRAAELLTATGDSERSAFALKAAAELEPKVNRLTIEAPAIDGLVVKRDGAVMDVSALGKATAVDPGVYEVEASAPGHEPWSKSVTLTGVGVSETVKIPELERTGAVPDPNSVLQPTGPDEGGMSGLMLGGIIVAAVGVVALAVGAGLGGVVLADSAAAEDDPALCPSKVCTPAGREAIKSAESKALVSNILIGVGAAAAVGGVLMIIFAPSDDAQANQEARFEPLVGPGYIGARVRF